MDIQIWPILNANFKHRFWPDTHIELSSNLKIHFFVKELDLFIQTVLDFLIANLICVAFLS